MRFWSWSQERHERMVYQTVFLSLRARLCAFRISNTLTQTPSSFLFSRSWNGNSYTAGPDGLGMMVNGDKFWLGVFDSNEDESYRRGRSPGGIGWEMDSKDFPKDIGFMQQDDYYRDQIHEVTLYIPRSMYGYTGVLYVQMLTKVTGSASDDESSGFDNFWLKGYYDCHKAPRPTPVETARPTPAPPTRIIGRVLEDTNNDGIGTDGIEGVTVTLFANSDLGNELDSFVTGPNGGFGFFNLPSGRYVVVQENLPGFVSVSDSDPTLPDFISDTFGVNGLIDDIIRVELANGVPVTDLRFVDTQASSMPSQSPTDVDLGIIGGNVFDDKDGGTAEGIEGVTVTLFSGGPMGQEVDTTTTDASGAYLFEDVRPGRYIIVETDLTGFVSVSDTDPSSPPDFITAVFSVDGDTDNFIVVTLLPGEVLNGNDFVDTQASSMPSQSPTDVDLGSIAGTVSDDKDGGTAEGIEGVTVTLFSGGPMGQEVDTTTTDANGEYLFEDVRPGRYIIVETDPSGFVSVSDTDPSSPPDFITAVFSVDGLTDNFIVVTLGPGQVLNSNDFVDTQVSSMPSQSPTDVNLGSISGNVGMDNDNNGVSEGGIEGSTIKLFSGGPLGELVDETTTDASGNYIFEDVRPGRYIVVQKNLDGFISQFDTDPNR